MGAAPSLPAEPGTQPIVTVGGGGVSAPASDKFFTTTVPQSSGPSRSGLPKKFLIPALVIVVLLAGSAAAYFGYYQNPSVIYSQSLSNTGKGYDKLVDYLDQQSKSDTKGYTGSGTYSIKSSGYSTDGDISYKSDGKNTDMTFDVGLDVTRVNTDIRTIKTAGAVPDVYFKLTGIKGLGTTLGEPSLDHVLAKLDGRWIVIDHTLLENLQAAATQSGATQVTSPTRDQVMDEARAFGQVNDQYVFTASKDKAVMKVVKKYGKETIDGHKTYHYQVALQPGNVKKYILAQRDALQHSKLDAWLKKNHVETSALSSFNDAAKSTKDIKSSDTFDIWMDTSHRIIYKVRVSSHPNPAENYVDVGLGYKGGDDYPFFVNIKSKDSSSGLTTMDMTADLNTRTNAVNFKLDDKLTGSGSDYSVTSNFDLKANATAISITAPKGAMSLSQALSELGLGSLLKGVNGSSSSSASSGSATTISKQLSSAGNSTDAVKNALLAGLLGTKTGH